MSKSSDQHYLLNSQYRDAANLKARINLHTRFSTNSYDWFRFVFDHINLPENSQVLELGCGPGVLWTRNLERIPPGWNVTLSDFSPGMLEEARKNLSESNHPFDFRLIDAQEIPFDDGQLDAVIANHMLYHIPNLDAAFSEIHRVLKPGGYLYAATNGEKHLETLNVFFDYLSLAKPLDQTFSAHIFTLENGAAKLSPWFQTETYCYDDALVITESEPLVAYLLSMVPSDHYDVNQDEVAKLSHEIKSQIQNKGSIHISKSTGLLISQKINKL